MPTQELLIREPAEVQRKEPTLMEIISAVVANPQVDVAKLQAILEMKERLEARDAEREFNAAMARLSPKLPHIRKDGTIDMGGKGKMKFARYEDIDAIVRPLETAEGLSRQFFSEPTKDGVLMGCVVRHIGGHSGIPSKMLLPPDVGAGRNALQAIGSSHHYGKRYLTIDVYNIVTVGADDDGNKAYAITQEQDDAIETFISEIGENCRADFLRYMNCSKVSEIKQDNYRMAIEALKAKQRANQRKATR